MSKNIESRLEKLEEAAPRPYRAFDAEGEITIESDLDGTAWVVNTMELSGKKGHEKEKEGLLAALRRTVREDGGGRLFELARAMLAGPVEEKPPVSAPARKKKR